MMRQDVLRGNLKETELPEKGEKVKLCMVWEEEHEHVLWPWAAWSCNGLMAVVALRLSRSYCYFCKEEARVKKSVSSL